MSPTLNEGDLALVDVRDNRFKFDGLYMLRDGGDLSIKRVQRQPDGALVLRSDNAAYQPVTVAPESITVLGRIIWIGRRP